MDRMIERMTEIEEDLASRAFLFDHPETYRAAIEIAFKQVRAEIDREHAVA
jgi:hypothetical protein